MSTPTPANALLRDYVDRIERLRADRAAIDEDIAFTFNQAKGDGFDRQALAALLKRRAQDKAQAAEFGALVDLYETAVSGAPEQQQPNPQDKDAA